MSSQAAPRPRSRITILMLCLLLAIGVFCVVHRIRSTPPKAQAAAPASITDKAALALVPKVAWETEGEDDDNDDDAFDARHPLRVASHGTLSLQPGETAVLSYWDIEPGINGMVLVTPQMRSDGLVGLNLRMLEVPDDPAADATIESLLPDIFGNERYQAIAPATLEALLSSIEASKNASVTNYRMISQPGSAVSFRSIIRQPDAPEDEWLGTLLNLRATSLADSSGGFDLDLDFDRRGSPADGE